MLADCHRDAARFVWIDGGRNIMTARINLIKVDPGCEVKR
jgi:hypothetical protein